MSVKLRFIFISEPERPVVTITLPGSRLFREAFVMASKEQGKDPVRGQRLEDAQAEEARDDAAWEIEGLKKFDPASQEVA